MLTLHPKMDAARKSLVKQPAFAVQFEGIPYNFGAGAFGFSEPFRLGDGVKLGDINPSTGVVYKLGDVRSTSLTTVRTLLAPSGFGADVTPDEGASSFSGVSIPIQHSAEFEDALANYAPFKGRKVTVRWGFLDVSSDKWIVAFTGIVDNITAWGDQLGWDISCSDIQRSQRTQVFAPLQTPITTATTKILNLKTALSGGGITSGATTITVQSTGGFPSSGYIKIGSESIQYTGTTLSTFTGCTRGVLGTQAESHSNGTAVHTGTAGDATLYVVSTAGFVIPGYITIGDETVYATGTTATTFTGVTRARIGTLAEDHADDASVSSGTPADDVITVASTVGFPAFGWIKIQEEIIYYAGVTATSFTGCKRAQFTSIAAAHQGNEQASEVLNLEGNPIDITLKVLTSTGTATNGSYDVLPERHGLGIPIAFVDIAQFLTIRSSLGASAWYEFQITEAEDAKSWLEREIYKPNGLYQIVAGDGSLRLKLFDPPSPSAGLFSFTDANVILDSVEVDANYPRQYNQIIWEYDFDIVTGKYLSSLTIDEPSSQSRYGFGSGKKIYAFNLQSKGMRTKLRDGSAGNAAPIATARSGRLFSRYADPPLIVRFDAFYETFHVEPGDLVIASLSFVLNPRTGKRGFIPGYVMEVTSRTPNCDKGTMSFTLEYTPFAGARYGKLAPVGTVDYPSATAQQIGDASASPGTVWVWFGSSSNRTDGKASLDHNPNWTGPTLPASGSEAAGKDPAFRLQ